MSDVAVRPARWDTALTVLLVLALGAGALLAVVIAALTAFDADECANVRCTYPVISTGLAIATIGQPVVVVIAMVALWVRRARGRRLFVAPLIGLAVSATVLIGGLLIFSAGIPGSSIW